MPKYVEIVSLNTAQTRHLIHVWDLQQSFGLPSWWENYSSVVRYANMWTQIRSLCLNFNFAKHFLLAWSNWCHTLWGVHEGQFGTLTWPWGMSVCAWLFILCVFCAALWWRCDLSIVYPSSRLISAGERHHIKSPS